MYFYTVSLMYNNAYIKHYLHQVSYCFIAAYKECYKSYNVIMLPYARSREQSSSTGFGT